MTQLPRGQDKLAELRQMATRLADELTMTAFSGTVDELREKLRDLDAIARLLLHNTNLTPPKAPARWPVVLLLAIALVTITALSILHVRTTEIELTATVRSINLTPAASITLGEPMLLDKLKLSGLSSVTIPYDSRYENSPFSARVIEVTPVTPNGGINPGTITIETVTVPVASRFAMLTGSEPGKYRLRFYGFEPDLKVNLDGNLRFSVAGRTLSRTYNPPQPLTWHSKDGVTLDISLPVKAHCLICDPIRISSLSFDTEIDRVADDTILKRSVSTIQTGRVTFLALNDKLQQLHRSEELSIEMEDSQPGDLRSVILNEEGTFTVEYHAVVKGLTVITNEGKIDLRPTWLAWLAARQPLSIAWAGAIYLFTLGIVVMRFFGVKV